MIWLKIYRFDCYCLSYSDSESCLIHQCFLFYTPPRLATWRSHQLKGLRVLCHQMKQLWWQQTRSSSQGDRDDILSALRTGSLLTSAAAVEPISTSLYDRKRGKTIITWNAVCLTKWNLSSAEPFVYSDSCIVKNINCCIQVCISETNVHFRSLRCPHR